MSKEKIEALRQILNDMIIDENVNMEELLRISEELDKLIVQFMREQINMKMQNKM